MSKIRYQNEKMKRKYFDWAKGALGLSEKTMKVKESALWKYDEFTKYQDYKKFNAEVRYSGKYHFAEHPEILYPKLSLMLHGVNLGTIYRTKPRTLVNMQFKS